MPWPLSQDYNEAIQDPLHNFSDADLKTGEAVANALGIPMPRSGNFADVYEMRCPSGSRWAVKCFTREVFGLSERYAEISKYLHLAHLPFMVDFKYLQQGIRVRGQWYPILKMQWVEGFLLNEFVRDNLDKKPILQALGQIWLRMAKRLRESYIAHCDLQHGNVLLVPGPSANSLAVKLIDYDGMCVPSLAGTKSGEVGHPAYQHPERLRTGAYDQEVDRFSLLSIATALHCLMIGGRSLWERYDNGDNLLFRQSDFQAPAQAPLFRELLTIRDSQALMLVKELHRACQGRLDAVPLLTDLLPEAQARAASKSSATMKRASIVQTAAQASPTADTTATGSAWVFKEEDKPRSRRRRKGGMMRWVVGVGLAGMLLAGGMVGLSIWSGPGTPNVAQNNPRVKPSTPKGSSHAPTNSKEPKPEEEPPKPSGGSHKPEGPKQRENGDTLEASLTEALKMKFAWVPAGKSWLGGGGGNPGTQEFTLTKGLWCGVYPVTQAEWQGVMDNNPSRFRGNPRKPVERVSWNDTQVFLHKLNSRSDESGLTYRLPSAEEWEYICRGGPISQNQSAYHFYFARFKYDLTSVPTNDLSSEQANFNGNYPAGSASKGPYLQATCEVGLYLPNPLGIYDLHGNVWEWTSTLEGSSRVIRGGCWLNRARGCTASFRSRLEPGIRYSSVGFRVLAVPSGAK